MFVSKYNVWQTTFANNNDAFIPEIWAMESLMILFENIVAAQLVHRDFSSEIANFGDVVNTRQPAKFESARKIDTDNVTDQDATSTNVAVKLDQHHHVSFVIKDGEESKGFASLRDTYLVPALQAVANAIDEVVVGQKYEFLDNMVGDLETTADRSAIIAAGVKLDENLAPPQDRNLIVSPAVQGDLLNVDAFHEADKVGDNGTAMREGSLGKKFGFQTHMSQNNRSIVNGDVSVDLLVNLAAGYSAGDTSIVCDGHSGAIANGTWCQIAGDDTPQFITATSGGGTPVLLTIAPGLQSAVDNNAIITLFDPGLINLGAGYAADFSKSLVIDAVTLPPRRGQLVSTGAATASRDSYSAIGTPTTTSVLLNRPLGTAVVDDALVGLGPGGEFSFAFHRNAVALVSRPLALPVSGAGAISSVQEVDGISVRVTVTYDGQAQGHRVTVDLLCGVKTLDTDLGVVLLSA